MNQIYIWLQRLKLKLLNPKADSLELIFKELQKETEQYLKKQINKR